MSEESGETFPQWWSAIAAELFACVRRDSKNSGVVFHLDGTEEPFSYWHESYVDDRTRLTEAEARERLNGSGIAEMNLKEMAHKRVNNPTCHSADTVVIRRALSVAQDAKEYATELLAVHDSDLGRTTRKNKMWAEVLESSIKQAEQSIVELREVLGVTDGEAI